jgi:hypothetical protein
MNTIKVLMTKQPLDRNVFSHPVKVVVESAAHTEASSINSTMFSRAIAILHVAQKFSWLKLKLAST